MRWAASAVLVLALLQTAQGADVLPARPQKGLGRPGTLRFNDLDDEGSREPYIRMIVPAFEGGKLGAAVATVLNLQLWRTLIPSPAIYEEKFSGRVTWSPDHLAQDTFEGAEEVAVRMRAQMLLWGKAWEFGDGICVKCFLTIPEYPHLSDLRPVHAEQWAVDLKVGEKEFHLRPDLPTRRYELPALVLKPEIVRKFTDNAAIEVHQDKDLKSAVLRPLGLDRYQALDHAGGWSHLKVFGKKPVTGWVQLPELSTNRTYLVDYIGGLLRVFRGDYTRAKELLEPVSKAGDAPQRLRLDSLLYLAQIASQEGKSPLVLTRAALKVDPYAASAARYHLTGLCADYVRQRNGEPGKGGRFAEMLEAALNEQQPLFSPDDETVKTCRAIVAALRTSNS